MTQIQLSKEDCRILALAGVFQAAALTKQIAWRGRADNEPYQASLHSIFKLEANDVVEIYQSVSCLALGLKEMIAMLSPNKNKDPEIARYALSLLHLERKLIKQPQMLSQIQQGIERAQQQRQHFQLTHENIVANIAGIYTDTISTLSVRIHVAGEESLLRSNVNANRVRALLLAGIRSAVLWRQLGGSRWQLIFGRKSMVKAATQLLEKINVETVYTN